MSSVISSSQNRAGSPRGITFADWWPLARGVLWAGIGYMIGTLIVALIEHGSLASPRELTAGYIFGLIGWFMGVGVWEGWVKPSFGGEETWINKGVGRYFRFGTEAKATAHRYTIFAIVTFFIAGMLAMAIRIDLLSPHGMFFANKQQYNEAFSIHGTLMLLAVAALALMGGVGNFILPPMIGARQVVYPKLMGISSWFVPPAVVAVAMSPMVGGYESGWMGFPPLAQLGGTGIIFYFLGGATLLLSSWAGAINFLGTFVFMRAKGMTLSRVPMFVYGVAGASVILILFVPYTATAFLFNLFDMIVGTKFFALKGGITLAYQDMFWWLFHPEVYVFVLPVWTLWLEMIVVFTRRSLFGRGWAIAGVVGVTAISGVVGVHHFFTQVSDVRLPIIMGLTEMVSVPTGFFYLAAIGTLWGGRIRMTSPMLLMLMSMVNFLNGGLTGVFNSDVPANLQIHNTFFVVGHFHYTILGSMLFTWIAALYYYFPKVTGRMVNEFWAKFHGWWFFIFFNLTFFPMYIAGLDGMNRRVATYLPYLQSLNEWISISSFLLGAGFLIPLVNLVYSYYRGPIASDNPWGSKTLDWQMPTPPPYENFPFGKDPVVVGDFYNYEENAPDPVIWVETKQGA
ncbi:cytochrome c oxidase subunit I [Acidihalobacter yilgarnensis]|uniref:cytochrome c oxidase subunit I n=1 Tax=Acidihalobacter yilgarnensis TaxID=2819280 RepID=UPI0009F3ABC0|nr:cbb3-type cytochrome c oxidase subunit I [Acidihalobacter yilgarnensis]